MLVETIICIRPFCSVSKVNSLNKLNRSSSPKLGFPGKSICGKFVSPESGKRVLKRMIGASRTPVRSKGDERMRAFEQGAFVDESTSFGSGGLEATLNSLSKWLIAALFGVIVLWRHDAEALWAAMGSVFNSVLSIVLKRILNQERPVSTLRSDPGMPSSHAQSIFYTVTFTILSMVEWFGLNRFTASFCAAILAVGAYFSWLRVSQRLHTVSQVVVGAILGSTVSFLWFWSWHSFILKAFISSLLVRVIVVLGAAGICLGFLIYVIRYWVMEER